VDLYFYRVGVNGGTQLWQIMKVDEVRNLDWKSPLPDFVEKNMRDGLVSRIKDVYRDFTFGGGTIYDQNQVAGDLVQQVADHLRAKGLFKESRVIVTRLAGIWGGGLRLGLALGQDRDLEVKFHYQGRQGQVHLFDIQEEGLSLWQYRVVNQTGQYQKLPLDK